MHKLENSLLNILRQSNVKSLLVAISGGADSVALLCGCVRIAPRLGLRVEAVNCNFHLRGKESDRDSEFTAGLCNALNVRLHTIDYNVESYLKAHPGSSTEMACRELRYADFFRIIREEKIERIAVAHNADDDIETMILNMLRGSGSRGLRGMDLDNGKVIRPLLGIARTEIESYLSVIDQDFITDSSNLSSDYRRNFIRRDVLPLLESHWHGARKSLSKTVAIMKEENEIIETHYRKQLECLCPDANTLLVYDTCLTLGTIVRFIEKYGGNSEIAKEIFEARDKEFKERIWKLSERYSAVLERDKLIITDMDKEETEPEFLWSEIGMTPEMMAEIKSNRNHNIVYLPHDNDEYIIRHPKTGDKISPLGMKGKRLVSDIISDAKLSNKAKAGVRVLVRKKDGEIIWVTGLKRSRHDLIPEN
ncbi:MAG: tRNA lysidine(34) synthetase TilS, partial [Muribaculaceae bacterium]|nr:tRNA lysidine(34) synthetase TilS [Muribaculaceae bacterium]